MDEQAMKRALSKGLPTQRARAVKKAAQVQRKVDAQKARDKASAAAKKTSPRRA